VTIAFRSTVTCRCTSSRTASRSCRSQLTGSGSTLLACRNARIYEFDGTGVTTPDYDDLQAVSLTRGFLAAPERYLRALDSDALEEDS
jgi:hypothetical protein